VTDGKMIFSCSIWYGECSIKQRVITGRPMTHMSGEDLSGIRQEANRNMYIPDLLKKKLKFLRYSEKRKNG
jgi:hypothetical protein